MFLVFDQTKAGAFFNAWNCHRVTILAVADYIFFKTARPLFEGCFEKNILGNDHQQGFIFLSKIKKNDVKMSKRIHNNTFSS